MQRKRSPLLLGCPVRFRDRWDGRLVAFQVDEHWLVLNVVVQRGLLRRRQVRLPFSAAIEWNDELLAFDCTSDEAFARAIPPVAAPATPLSACTTLSAADARLAGALVEPSSRQVGHLLLARGLLAADRRLAPVPEVALEGGVLKLTAQADTLPLYRPDPDLLQAARGAIAAHPYLTADDRRALEVDAVDGVVYLSGNVRTAQAAAYALEAASSVAGAPAVRTSIVNDRQLEVDVARALGAAGLYRLGRLYVRAALGEVIVGGFVSDQTAIAEVERVAARVPGVRSVTNRIEVSEAAPPSVAPAPPSMPVEPEPAAASQPAEA